MPKTTPQGLKPFSYQPFAARLKPCPFENLTFTPGFKASGIYQKLLPNANRT
jgi:hypothetical protein